MAGKRGDEALAPVEQRFSALLQTAVRHGSLPAMMAALIHFTTEASRAGVPG